MKPLLAFLLLLSLGALLCADQQGRWNVSNDIAYRSTEELSPYMRERCKLDLQYPGTEGFATVVWFHGGGLKQGNKSVPMALRKEGFAVVAVNYRLHPKVEAPAYIEDAAAAVAWTLKHIANYGGDPKQVFVAGHSAGGYLTSMVGLDKRWLAAHDLDADQLAGLIPYSGQTITHSTIRQERDIPNTRAIIDELAPLYHVRKEAPPILLITGGRDLELRGRYEENAYFWRMMQVVGHADCTLHELDGFNHGTMVKPAHTLLIEFVRKHSEK